MGILGAKSDAPMRALSFMIGEWELDYTVTQNGRTTRTIRGTGALRFLFNATYLNFDYQAIEKASGAGIGEAHGIFAWDEKAGRYRYYWFESSGSFRQATGVLEDAHTLALEWQEIKCTQIFRSVSTDAMYLEMRCPEQDLLLRVDFTRIPAG